MMGGYTRPWGLHSYEGGIFAELTCFGTGFTAHTRDDLLNSKLIIMWGWNPAVTIQDTNTAWYLAQAKERGTKIISIDPRFTASASAFAHHWIPIRPGTDAAALIAMANVMVTENLHEQAFLDKFTIGFDAFWAMKTEWPRPRNGRRRSPAYRRILSGGLPGNMLQRSRWHL
jgi:anaerobic dimethyl sulfoxide reductase subunit A